MYASKFPSVGPTACGMAHGVTTASAFVAVVVAVVEAGRGKVTDIVLLL